MGAWRHRLAVMAMATTVGGGLHPPAAGAATDTRVRAADAVIAALVQQAGERSPTFRRLVETIDASDGLVVIREGRCGHGRRACLVNVTMAGATRMLWVKLDTRGTPPVLMGLIGHELQHAVEVLADPSVTTASALYAFYSRTADVRRSDPAFETAAAVAIGEAVLVEVRRAFVSGAR